MHFICCAIAETNLMCYYRNSRIIAAVFCPWCRTCFFYDKLIGDYILVLSKTLRPLVIKMENAVLYEIFKPRIFAFQIFTEYISLIKSNFFNVNYLKKLGLCLVMHAERYF